MEKGNGSKIIAVVALVLAVAGLSVGFAAYTSTLNISSTANANVGSNLWNVGFGSSSDMYDLTTPTSLSGTLSAGASSSSSGGTVNVLKYTIAQGTAATLSTSGEYTTYSLKIRNDGQIAATLNSITAGGITCAYPTSGSNRVIEQDSTPNTGAQATAGSGTITDSDCRAMFKATLTINNVDYDISTAGTVSVTTHTINAGSSVDAVLKIESLANGTPSTAPNGDFTVTLANTTVVYGSASGS